MTDVAPVEAPVDPTAVKPCEGDHQQPADSSKEDGSEQQQPVHLDTKDPNSFGGPPPTGDAKEGYILEPETRRDRSKTTTWRGCFFFSFYRDGMFRSVFFFGRDEEYMELLAI